MEKFFNIFTTSNSIIAFYFILTSLRQLTYGVDGDVSPPLLPGMFFLSLALLSQVTKKAAIDIFGDTAGSKNEAGRKYERNLTELGVKE
jgi:hypothetical protein